MPSGTIGGEGGGGASPSHVYSDMSLGQSPYFL